MQIAGEWAVAKGFGDVIAGDAVGIVEVGDRACDAEDAVVGARRESESVGGAHEEGAGVGIELRGGGDQAHGCGCVGIVGVRVERGLRAALLVADRFVERMVKFGVQLDAQCVGGEMLLVGWCCLCDVMRQFSELCDLRALCGVDAVAC